tara:strand:+ start:589 stop:1119 length:531 start_codon:yes stop_codon:yes gene_type:complete
MPFESVSAAEDSQCDHRTIESDDVELWLIRVPPNFQPEELHDRTIDLSRESTALGEGSQSTGYCLRSAPAHESAGIVSVFPSTRHKRWLLGKPVARQLNVTLALSTASASLGAARPLPRVPCTEGLGLRPAPPGGPAPPPTARAAEADDGKKRARSKGDAGKDGAVLLGKKSKKRD